MSEVSLLSDVKLDNSYNPLKIYTIKNSWANRALIHDIIKIMYVRTGYISKNYPPHLISDAEMIYSFLPPENEDEYDIYLFKDYYPKLPGLSSELQEVYDTLKISIKSHLKKFLASNDDKRKLPDWVYSYMLGVPLSVMSDKQDIHDYLVMIDNDNIDDLYQADTAEISYYISKRYLAKYPDSELDDRPPTIFGEPHVLRYANILYSNQQYLDEDMADIIKRLKDED